MRSGLRSPGETQMPGPDAAARLPRDMRALIESVAKPKRPLAEWLASPCAEPPATRIHDRADTGTCGAG